jgi:hypothetical protein
VVGIGESGVDHDLTALASGQLGEGRSLDQPPELGPGAAAVLSGEQELGVGEQEAVAVADDSRNTLADDLVACAESADELFGLAPVVVEARTVGNVTHDGFPFRSGPASASTGERGVVEVRSVSALRGEKISSRGPGAPPCAWSRT